MGYRDRRERDSEQSAVSRYRYTVSKHSLILFPWYEHMSTKSIWWSITAFDDEIALCEGTLPEFVKEIYGGRENCPTTGKLHFQGALRCFEQVRMAKLKSWLKKAHLEPARSSEALKKYAMKEETSAGVKVIRENPVPHYTAQQICLLLAQTSRQTDKDFWWRARSILRQTPGLAGQLMNPSLRGFYEKTQDVWLEQVAIVLQQPTAICSCGKDECAECFEKEICVESINGLPSPSSPSSQEEEYSPPDSPRAPSGFAGAHTEHVSGFCG